MALAMMAVLSIMTAGVLLAGTANESTSYVSDQQREAFEIAQQGLAYAEGMLDYNTAHGVAVSVGTGLRAARAACRRGDLQRAAVERQHVPRRDRHGRPPSPGL